MSTTSIGPGDVWLAHIPFTSGQAGKVRPVLVLWLDGQDCVVCAVTSAQPRGHRDLPLGDWMEEGLLRPSTCRLGHLNTMEQRLLVRHIGRLTAADAARILAAWHSHIRPGWATDLT